MLAVVTVLAVLSVSVLITRIATIALTHTGLSKQVARFQARSAFSGVGYTTSEAETIVNHPVRRRIILLLMLMGNVGIVTVLSSTIIAFVGVKESTDWLWRLLLLFGGLAALWAASYNRWVDQRLSRLIRIMLRRWTDLDVRDYVGLLHLGGQYVVTELQVQESDWLAGRTLGNSRLRDEGLMVLGIQRVNGEFDGTPGGDTEVRAGDTLVIYGSVEAVEALDRRRKGIGGELSHLDGISRQKAAERKERKRDAERTQVEKPS